MAFFVHNYECFLLLKNRSALIDFNSMTIQLVLFFAKRLGNCIHCILTFFVLLFHRVFLHTAIAYKVFLSNTNIYIVSRNYFYLIIVICLHTVIWFQVTNNNPWFALVLWHINHCWLFMPNPVFTYILNI